MDAPEIGMLHPHSYGFPSGAAQVAMFLGVVLIYYWRSSRVAWIVGLSYILLVSFSRLYLGVHYPIDVAGGWIIGACLALLFIYTKEPIDRFLEKKSLSFRSTLSFLIPLGILLIFPSRAVAYIIGSAWGTGLGTMLSLKYHLFLPDCKNWKMGVARSAIGIAMLYFVLFVLPGPEPLISFAVALVVSLATSPVCTLLKAV